MTTRSRRPAPSLVNKNKNTAWSFYQKNKQKKIYNVGFHVTNKKKREMYQTSFISRSEILIESLHKISEREGIEPVLRGSSSQTAQGHLLVLNNASIKRWMQLIKTETKSDKPKVQTFYFLRPVNDKLLGFCILLKFMFVLEFHNFT